MHFVLQSFYSTEFIFYVHFSPCLVIHQVHFSWSVYGSVNSILGFCPLILVLQRSSLIGGLMFLPDFCCCKAPEGFDIMPLCPFRTSLADSLWGFDILPLCPFRTSLADPLWGFDKCLCALSRVWGELWYRHMFLHSQLVSCRIDDQGTQ